MQCLHVDHRRKFSLRSIAEYPGRAFQQLVTPLFDLVWMDVKVLRQLDQSSLTLDCRYSYFCLESRALWTLAADCISDLPAEKRSFA